MSLMSVILAFAPALAARFQPKNETPIDDKAHPRFLLGYSAGLEDGRRAFHAARERLLRMEMELERVRRQRDSARDELCRRLRDQPLAAQALAQPLPHQPPSAQHFAMLEQIQRAQALVQQQMLAQQGMIAGFGAQESELNAGMWPNCTPARHDALTGRRGELLGLPALMGTDW